MAFSAMLVFAYSNLDNDNVRDNIVDKAGNHNNENKVQQYNNKTIMYVDLDKIYSRSSTTAQTFRVFEPFEDNIGFNAKCLHNLKQNKDNPYIKPCTLLNPRLVFEYHDHYVNIYMTDYRCKDYEDYNLIPYACLRYNTSKPFVLVKEPTGKWRMYMKPTRGCYLNAKEFEIIEEKFVGGDEDHARGIVKILNAIVDSMGIDAFEHYFLITDRNYIRKNNWFRRIKAWDQYSKPFDQLGIGVIFTSAGRNMTLTYQRKRLVIDNFGTSSIDMELGWKFNLTYPQDEVDQIDGFSQLRNGVWDQTING